ncbi:hypothetical protein B0T18DRAFT_312824, partial [Schizothecium vesticola]
PVLKPAWLILTKIKRAVMYIGSTRPASRRKLAANSYDINFLLSWLQHRGQTIDFSGYPCANSLAKDRLYLATASLWKFWEEKQLGDFHLLRSVLTDDDQEIVISVDVPGSPEIKG